MDKLPLISVIVPVYKVEAYLDRCVQSIVDQTYTNLEIILVDDGSPDRCPHMCDEWAKRDNRIRVIHQKNRGSGAARNA
ncbi:MAG: glycosyltransferase family 2 protein, partial [Candidatus Ventricola sp.]